MQKMSEEIAIYCLKAESERYSEVCEECPQYGKVGCDHCCEDAFEVAIQALEKQSMVNEILHECTELKRELDAYKAVGTVEELQKSVKEEDVLKFYYIESEDKYVVGQRVGNFYYAEFGKTGFTFYMSRYLPWGKHVVSPTTAWKEHTYPSKPKEMPFFEWLQGFIKKECGGTLDQCREAVERMKPKKPVEYEDKYYGCPKCGNALMHKWEKYPTILNPKSKGLPCCWNCLQAIDWSE